MHPFQIKSNAIHFTHDSLCYIELQLSNPSEVINVDMMSASPPPYHIAIMATKDTDESPPPAYHAIMAIKDAK